MSFFRAYPFSNFLKHIRISDILYYKASDEIIRAEYLISFFREEGRTPPPKPIMFFVIQFRKFFNILIGKAGKNILWECLL